MRVVAVIDIRGGRAVHASGGVRDGYMPVGVVAGVPVDGDVVKLGRVYADRLRLSEIYVADLDAITEGIGSLNAGVLGGLVAIGVPVMVDAGVSTVQEAQSLLEAGASRVIVGLETLTGFDALDDICRAVGGERVICSIDLSDGALLAAPNVVATVPTVDGVARRAAAAGVGALIVLDLARVGSGRGPDLEAMRLARAGAPHVALFAGGGVRDNTDLLALAEAGCDGALVGTALHRGLLDV